MVASRAEAWIETAERTATAWRSEGRLSRRGVDRNLHGVAGHCVGFESPLAQRRGSKRIGSELQAEALCRLSRRGVDRNGWASVATKGGRVASRAEAWIETVPGALLTTDAWGRLSRRGVDRNYDPMHARVFEVM